MHQPIASTLTFVGTIAAAALAAALMSGNARAEGPIDDSRPTAGALSRGDVKMEVMQHRQQLTSFGGEWALQQHTGLQPQSASTREQVRADYIAAREEVRAMTAEDSGSRYLALKATRAPVMMAADAALR